MTFRSGVVLPEWDNNFRQVSDCPVGQSLRTTAGGGNNARADIKWVWRRFDIVRLLGSFGLRTLSMKLFAGMLALTSLSILLVCVIAYWSFSSAIESGEQLQGVARAAAEASELFLSENIKFAKGVAADDAVVAAAEHAAREAEH